ncbi:hypothetical protein TNCV_373041 [Trichonephila clavipes]|nr:hypothetical protein TNCV_373041 [Trichonephila clavipes]
MVDPSVSVNTVEVTPPLITRCDKSTQTISPYLHVKRLDFGKRRMDNVRPIKDSPSNRNPRRILFNRLFQKTLFCGCLEIIHS